MRDVVVIGAGLAGLSAAARLAGAGLSVTLVNQGIGGLSLGQGTIDVMGYSPELVKSPLKAVDSAAKTHPYSHFTGEEMRKALLWIKAVMGDNLLAGDGETNLMLPTAAGVLRPTALAQPSMMNGAPSKDRKYLIVGLKRLKDFYPSLVAENLSLYKDEAGASIAARSAYIDLEVRPGEQDTSAVNFARALDNAEVRQDLVMKLAPLVEDGETVGLPAVLGIKDPLAWWDLEERLGHPIFEIPLPPPSVPGMRLGEKLLDLVKSKCRVMNGSAITGFESQNGEITAVIAGSAGRATRLEARQFVLATGGFESGGLVMDSYENVTEPIFGLPVEGQSDEPFNSQYWDSDQAAFLMGLQVDNEMRPLAGGKPAYPNLRAIGGLLPGATRWREKSGDGIAVISALRAADAIGGKDE